MSNELDPNNADHRWIGARAKDSLFQGFLDAASEQEAINKALHYAAQTGITEFKKSFLDHARKAMGLPAGTDLLL